jgi:hypothetical protein
MNRNPTPKPSSDGRVHCEKLAKLNREAASTVRTLADYHQNVAAGTATSQPTVAEHLRNVAPPRGRRTAEARRDRQQYR